MTQTPPDPGTYEGDEPPRDGSVPPPQRYGDRPPTPPPVVSGPVEPAPVPAQAAHREPTTADRLAAISGPLAVILFMIIGFAFDGWAWGWIVFLLPPLLYQWRSAGRKR